MTKHEWHEWDEDGERVYYRATHHAGRWEFFSTKEEDPEWNAHDALPLEVMKSFRQVLWNKHLRRRVPLKHVEQIDGMIERMEEQGGEGGDTDSQGSS